MKALVFGQIVITNTRDTVGFRSFTDVDAIKDQLGDGVKLLKWSSAAWPANDDTYLNTSLEKASPSAPNPPEKPGYNDRLLYIYTSGTTGLPKAAIITNVR